MSVHSSKVTCCPLLCMQQTRGVMSRRSRTSKCQLNPCITHTTQHHLNVCANQPKVCQAQWVDLNGLEAPWPRYPGALHPTPLAMHSA